MSYHFICEPVTSTVLRVTVPGPQLKNKEDDGVGEGGSGTNSTVAEPEKLPGQEAFVTEVSVYVPGVVVIIGYGKGPLVVIGA